MDGGCNVHIDSFANGRTLVGNVLCTTHRHTDTCTHTNTNSHTHTRTHAQTQKHKHTYTYTLRHKGIQTHEYRHTGNRSALCLYSKWHFVYSPDVTIATTKALKVHCVHIPDGILSTFRMSSLFENT